jgi:HAE1 family hydrophobic/amphiphilic exporter-1
MSISQRIVNRPVLVVVLFAVLLIVGIYSMNSIPLDLMPSVSPPYITVSTTYTGAAPETMEISVTKILEASLAKVQGVKSMTSISTDSSSSITLEFDYAKNLDVAVSDIRDKIDAVRNNLPTDALSPTVTKIDPNSRPIIRMAVRGNRSPEELRKLAEDTIEPNFTQVDGVATVSARGGRTAIIRVDVSQNRLEAYGITTQSIVSALATQNAEFGAGTLTDGNVEYTLQPSGAFSDVNSDIANAQIATKNGIPIRLKDVAKVYQGYEDATTSVYINGQSGVYLGIMKQTDANTVAVANGVYAKMKSMQAVLPSDIKLEIVNDDSTQIRSTIHDLIEAIVEGAILTMLFVFLFLRSLKSTIIIGLAIPIAVLITLLAVYFSGFTLNMMTMTGLLVSIGNIVDSSIVILDNTTRYRERGAKPKIAAILGSQEMMVAITAGILASLSVFVPIVIFANTLGMLGIMFKQMIFTIIISHIVSWCVAVFLVPVLASHYLPLSTREEKPLKNPIAIAVDKAIGRVIDSLGDAYKGALKAAISHRTVTVGAVLVILAASLLYFMPRLTIIFSPPITSNSVSLSITMPLGTPFDKTQKVVNDFADISKNELKGVQNIIGTTGTSGTYSSATSDNSGSLTISLPERSKRIDSDIAVQNKLRKHFKDYPSAIFAFQQSNRMGTRQDIDVTLSSTNYAGLSKVGREVLALIKAKVSGVTEPSSDYDDTLPRLDIQIDRPKAASFGISVQTIATEIRDAFEGEESTVYREGGDDYDVIVRLQPEDRTSVVDLNRLFMLSSGGQKVALSSIAKITKDAGPQQINRTSQIRTIDITGNLAPGYQANKVEDQIRQLIATNIAVPSDVYVSYTGSWTEVSSTSNTFLVIIVLAILLVFCVMAGQYESFKDPIINLCTIPLMLIGVLAAYALAGQTISMFTLVGIVMLVGIVVNNGILLVDYMNLLRGRGVSLMDACLQGGASRFRPVVMTAGATILGVVPMAFFPSDSSTITQPIGLAVVGGLASATFITLLLIPVIYYLLNVGKARKEDTL